MEILSSLEKRFEPVLIVVALSLIVLLVFANVVLRLFDTTLPWAGELSRYLFVWMVYLGISYCIREKRHLRVTVFVKMLPAVWEKVAVVISDLVFLIYSVLVASYGYLILMEAIERGKIAPAMEISAGFLYASILVGGALSAMRLVVSIVETLKGQKPLREET